MRMFFMFFNLILMSQAGNIRLGFQRNILMDENGEGGTGGGGAGGSDGGSGSGSGSGNQGGKDGGGSGSNSLNDLPEWAQNEIKSLRGESAKHRTANKELSSKLNTFETAMKKAGLLEDETPPEKKLESVTSQAEALAVQNALLEIAVEHGVSKDNFKYFSFLMNEKLAELKDDEELTEEQLTEILDQVSTGNKGSGNSSFGGGKGKGKGNEEQTGPTLEEFTKMGIMAKSTLFQKDSATYNRLVAEAKSKGLM